MKKKVIINNVKHTKRIPSYVYGAPAGVIGSGASLNNPTGYGVSTANLNPIMYQQPLTLRTANPNVDLMGMIGGPMGIAQAASNVLGGVFTTIGNSNMPSTKEMSLFSAMGQLEILDADDKASVASGVLSNVPVVGSLLGGVASLFGRRKRKKAIETAKKRDEALEDSKQISEESAALAANNDYSAAFSMAYGGEVPSSLAYVDGGEVLQTPQGQTAQVYDNSGKTDNVLVDIPVGTKILSDKLRVPGTKQTFAQYYKTHSSKAPKDASTDKRRLNSQQLNEENDQKLMNYLIQLQNEEQMRKGVKNKTKKLVPSRVYGEDRFSPDLYDQYDGVEDEPIVPNYQSLAGIASRIGRTGEPWDISTEPIITPITGSGALTRRGKILNYANKGVQGLTQAGTDALSLLPTWYNLRHANDVERVEPRRNPYSQRIISELSNRRFDASAPLRRNQSTYKTAVAGLDRSVTGGGNLAARVALANNKYLADSDVLAQKNNIDNQYRAQLASMLDNIGRQDVASMLTYDDINRRNLAAGRGAKEKALEGLSQFTQLKQKNKRQQQMQDMMFPLYQKFLSRGVESSLLEDLASQYYNNRRIGG